MITITDMHTGESVDTSTKKLLWRSKDFERMPWLLLSENDEWVVAGETDEYEFRINSGSADRLIQQARGLVEQQMCEFEECLLEVCLEWLNGGSGGSYV